jgi:hypothetical protein
MVYSNENIFLGRRMYVGFIHDWWAGDWKAVRWTVTRGWRRFGNITLSKCKRHFEYADMSHKMDELLHAAGLPTDINVIPDSTGDFEAAPTPHPPHFPYENADFTSILDSISIIP